MTEEDELIKCYLCHKKLLEEKVIEGKLVKILHPERKITQFYLNNNSRMDVAICMNCKNTDLNNPIIHHRIMKNIIDGWKIEQDILLSRGLINQKQADDCMDYHRKLTIKFRSEGLNDYQIKEKSK